MGVSFFWRMEGSTFSGTDDHVDSGVDNTPTASGSPTFDPAANCGVGTNGLLVDAAGEQYRFDTNTNLVDPSVGCVAFLFRMPSALSNGYRPLQIRGSTVGNQYSVQFVNTDEIEFIVGDPDGTPVKATTTAANLVANTVYGFVGRWDQPNSLLRAEVYGTPVSSPSLIQGITNSSGFTAPSDLAAGDRLRWGDVSGTGGTIHQKNGMISKIYAEPVQNNFGISSYTAYSSGGGGSAAAIASYLNMLRANQ